MTDTSASRGCLTAHFFTKIDLDYPCTLATSSSAEAAKAKRERELTATGEAEFEGKQKKKNGPQASVSSVDNPMSADIPYVANVTQATLEIKKSPLFLEKHAVFVREQETNARIAAESAAAGKRKVATKRKHYSSKEEEAAAMKEAAILADPLRALEGTHFVLNALPEIGNTGRPLALCHFIVDKGSLVMTNSTEAEQEEQKDGGLNSTLAIVRMPIHMCTSVGKQGRKDPEDGKKKKNKPKVELGEGGSSGLAGLELIYVPRKPAGGAEKKGPNNQGNQQQKNNNHKNRQQQEQNVGDSDADSDDLNARFHGGGKGKGKPNHRKNKGGNGKNAEAYDEESLFVDKLAGKRDVFPVAFFDVSVTIAGVQYTYLLHSQFDILAGRKTNAAVAQK